MKKFKDILKEDNTSFYLGKNNFKIEKLWKQREEEAYLNKTQGMTWSTTIDWGGFQKHISAARTIEEDWIIRKLEAEGMVKLELNTKKSYMTKKEFELHSMENLEGNLKLRDLPFGEKGYWKS
jgi:hypothetical protein